MVGGRVTYVALTSSGGCIVGEIASANSSDPGKYQSWDREIPGISDGGALVSIRLLYRRDMIEVYLNDFLLPVVLQSGAGSGRIGVLPNVASAKMSASLKGFRMTLPGTNKWPVHPLPPPPPPPPAPRPVPAGDLAEGAKTACSGYFSDDKEFACDKGADGNLATRWSSNQPYDGTWRSWQVDLGTAHRVGSVRISWELAWAKSYRLDSSLDGSDWQSFYNTSEGKGKVETIDNLSAHGRFVRINCTERFAGSPWGFSFWEVEIFEAKTAPPALYLDVRANEYASSPRH